MYCMLKIVVELWVEVGQNKFNFTFIFYYFYFISYTHKIITYRTNERNNTKLSCHVLALNSNY
jgi:hypothetical protein